MMLTFAGAQANAQVTNAGASVGVTAGFSVPDADNTNPRQMFGFMGTAFVTDSLSAGGYYLLGGSEHGDSSARDFDYSAHGIEGAYHIKKQKNDTYFAVRFGFSKLKVVQNSTELIFSPYHVGGAVGYDSLIYNWMSLGFEGSIVKYQSSDTDSNGTSYGEDPFTTLNFMVTLKFWL